MQRYAALTRIMYYHERNGSASQSERAISSKVPLFVPLLCLLSFSPRSSRVAEERQSVLKDISLLFLFSSSFLNRFSCDSRLIRDGNDRMNRCRALLSAECGLFSSVASGQFNDLTLSERSKETSRDARRQVAKILARLFVIRKIICDSFGKRVAFFN